ncbi:hypothetical protein V493_08123 [Pseudogymnoascus sp. VKM F-4281 (FW-2241)]|nr:hypothetical protein V493_08123 [Pseudogymnoascus sp. VKM F-4281 (FW-2241)]
MHDATNSLRAASGRWWKETRASLDAHRQGRKELTCPVLPPRERALPEGCCGITSRWASPDGDPTAAAIGREKRQWLS